MDRFIPLEGTITANQYNLILADQLDPIMKHFYHDGSSLFQEDIVSIHRAQGFTEWLDEYEGNEGIYEYESKIIFCALHSYQITTQSNTYGRFWTKVLDSTLHLYPQNTNWGKVL